MADSPTLRSLADRVESLTGPCRETDLEILFTIFPKDRVAIFDGVKHISTMTGRDGEPWFLPLADRDDCPRYTASLDAAMTLAQDNREAMVMFYVAHRTFEHAEMDEAPKLFPRIKAMLAWNLRARSALEASHG